MASYRAVAAKVAESKRLHPDQFCPVDRCLWRTGGGRCPRHPAPALPVQAARPFPQDCPGGCGKLETQCMCDDGGDR